MDKLTTPPVTDAVILMAGAGSRLGEAGGAIAKPLVRVGGVPLISYALDAFQRAGVRTVHAVMGAQSEQLAAELERLLPARMSFNPIINPNWQKQNGVSVLCAAGRVRAPFFLAMGDHLFDFAILEALLFRGDRQLVNLAIDWKIESIFDLDDAMKVQTQGEGLVAIGKDLRDYDAIDTGVFLCSDEIFAYLQRAQIERDDCSLSDGVRLLAAEGKMRVVDVGEAWWQDVDTPEMLARAEQQSARFLRQNGIGLAQESIARQR